ncbi:MAG TPA: type IIL restriction-modification enzyme MmeI, partial [Gemmatimonadales bacterium]|nr:type IIL restriction-modification enzyme MmeI [Gemmatimonadales bacterium]
MSTDLRLAELAERWGNAPASERANAQVYLIELCEALGVERPGPAGSGYQFELPIRAVHPDGTESTNFVDLYKQGCFLLEAKDEEPGRSNEVLLRKAFGQARSYISHLP